MLKKQKMGYALLTTLAAASLLLAACGGEATPEATPVDPDAIKTSAASTALAQLTEIAMMTPSATPTQEATSTPSPTIQPTAPTITATAATTPTQGVAPTTGGGGTVTTGDRAEFISDVTIPDGTDVQPGAGFTKTWRLRNAGTTTWTTEDYAVVRVGTDSIGGPDTVPLPKNVPPGEQVDISIDFTAPTTAGSYTSYWQLRNGDNKTFGIGPQATGSFYVQIDVTTTAGTGTPSSSQPTATQGSGSTPAPTATSGSSGSTGVSITSISIDTPNYTGSCPHDLTITTQFNLSQASTVTYQLEAGSNTPGYSFTMPPPVTSSFPAGTQTLVFYLNLTSTGTGWVKFHITAPQDVSSSEAPFTFTCQ